MYYVCMYVLHVVCMYVCRYACMYLCMYVWHCMYVCVYCGLPQVRLQPLEGALSAAARMIGVVSKFGHISEFMRVTLRWLPVRQRIHYRLSSIVWRCILGIAPTYLLELFILTSSCTGRQSLRSAS